MEEKDKNNLTYIMSLNDHDFDLWLDTIDYEDVEYAMRLIRQHRQELVEQEIELELQLDNMDLSQAQEILSRISKK